MGQLMNVQGWPARKTIGSRTTAASAPGGGSSRVAGCHQTHNAGKKIKLFEGWTRRLPVPHHFSAGLMSRARASIL